MGFEEADPAGCVVYDSCGVFLLSSAAAKTSGAIPTAAARLLTEALSLGPPALENLASLLEAPLPFVYLGWVSCTASCRMPSCQCSFCWTSRATIDLALPSLDALVLGARTAPSTVDGGAFVIRWGPCAAFVFTAEVVVVVGVVVVGVVVVVVVVVVAAADLAPVMASSRFSRDRTLAAESCRISASKAIRMPSLSGATAAAVRYAANVRSAAVGRRAKKSLRSDTRR
mmetsp:Transcript_10937/g.40887  ORF Transcript_10937/g.40887 Transcript_10937/m.40887 type:complete len:228 (-) Transcript_10937:423-1106(-)